MSTILTPHAPLVFFGAKRFGFAAQLERGARGVEALVTYLRAEGHEVVDLGADMEWQRRGVDLIVDGRAVEVKSDFHPAKNLYFEVSCGEKPGCIFTSRADDLYYYFPDEGVLYILPMADVQWWLATHLAEYRLITITSTRGTRTWTATGIAVPVTALKNLDTMRVVRWNSSNSTIKKSSTSGASASKPSKPTSSVSAKRRKTSGLKLGAFAQR